MIAFEELVAALDRWRVRNGLPVVDADLPPPAPSAAPAWPVASTYPSAPAAAAARPMTDSDVLALDDADVAEEAPDVIDEAAAPAAVADEYDNDGVDYSMSFGAGNPVGTASGTLGGAPEEATGMGPVPTSAEPPAMPGYGYGEDPQTYVPPQGYAYGEDAAPAYDGGGSGPYAQPGSGPYAQADSGGYAQGGYAQGGSGPYGQAGYDPSYAEPPPVEDAPVEVAPGDAVEDDDEDWSKLYPGAGGGAGTDTIDAEADVIDEATVVGDSGLPRK